MSTIKITDFVTFAGNIDGINPWSIDTEGSLVSMRGVPPEEKKPMTDEEIMKLSREYMEIAETGISDTDLDAMADAVFAERDRRKLLTDQHPYIGLCACAGPMPHCRCERRLLKQEIAAAVAALNCATGIRR